MSMFQDIKNGRFYLGDCLEVMKEIPDGVVDMLCDLPYGVVNRKSNGLRNLDKGAADVLTFDVESAITESLRVCSGSFYFFCGTEQVSAIRAQLVRCGLTTRLCVWEKTNSAHSGLSLYLPKSEHDTLARAARLFEEALPKFNWGARALDANAIQLLNEVPGKGRAAKWEQIPQAIGQAITAQPNSSGKKL